MLEKSLLRTVLGRASQTRQVDKNRNLLPRDSLFRQVEVEVHLAASGGGIVAQLEQLAAKGDDSGLGGDRHDGRDRNTGIDEGKTGDEPRTNINRKLTFGAGFLVPHEGKSPLPV